MNHRRDGVLLSGRFDGGPKEKALRDTVACLQGMGMLVHVVEAGVGQKFGQQTQVALYSMRAMVAFAYENCKIHA